MQNESFYRHIIVEAIHPDEHMLRAAIIDRQEFPNERLFTVAQALTIARVAYEQGSCDGA